MKHFFIKIAPIFKESQVEQVSKILQTLVERDPELKKKCTFTVFGPDVEIVEICETET